MKPLKHLLTGIFTAASLSGTMAQEKIIVVNEGLWQSDNGRLTYFEDGKVVSNQWFRDINGHKLGDTPNDIIQINNDLIAIALNWSNIVQFITPQGKAVAATEDIPNNRKMCTDGRYVYVTSYGHECYLNGRYVEFTKGYVAKIDITDFKVVGAVEVGYEPEGIAIYNGHLFVANSGGYAFQEGHDYESTVSVINAGTMQVQRTVDTGQINLYSKLSQSGKYLCINSAGDYYYVPGATIIFDCEAAIGNKPDNQCFAKLDCAATYNCVDSGGNFYAIGSRYSYVDGDYTFNYIVIDPEEVMESRGASGWIEDGLPGSVTDDIKMMGMPYGIYVNPYTGYIYATDAGSFTGSGTLYQWSPEGKLLSTSKLYINPAHFLALPPDGIFTGIDIPTDDKTPGDDFIYDLRGIRVDNPRRGQIYISNGKKFILK